MDKNKIAGIIIVILIGYFVYSFAFKTSISRPEFNNIEYVDSWEPNDKRTNYGFDLIYTGEISEQKLIEICKEFNNTYDEVVVRIFSTKQAYNSVQNDIFDDNFNTGYLVYYIKKTSNEIRWMQENGNLSSLFGTKHKF